MNKEVYLQKIKEKTGVSKKDIELVIEEFLEEIKENLIENQKASITNFGTFSLRTTKPYSYFSPIDGSKMTTSGINKIYFSSSRELLKKISR
jgi:DNA-binding protein HU-beta